MKEHREHSVICRAGELCGWEATPDATGWHVQPLEATMQAYADRGLCGVCGAPFSEPDRLALCEHAVDAERFEREQLKCSVCGAGARAGGGTSSPLCEGCDRAEGRRRLEGSPSTIW